MLRYAKEDVAFLRQYAVKMIIAACGTVSSIVGDQPFVTDMPFTGVVLPAARTACEVTRNGKIGIIGTPATIRSGSYEKAIQKLHSGRLVRCSCIWWKTAIRIFTIR